MPRPKAGLSMHSPLQAFVISPKADVWALHYVGPRLRKHLRAAKFDLVLGVTVIRSDG